MGQELCVQDESQGNSALGTEGRLCQHEASRSLCPLRVGFTSQRVKGSVEFFPPALNGFQEAGEPEWDRVRSVLLMAGSLAGQCRRAAVWGRSAGSRASSCLFLVPGLPLKGNGGFSFGDQRKSCVLLWVMYPCME